jgi:AraC-like DNA-binding protein
MHDRKGIIRHFRVRDVAEKALSAGWIDWPSLQHGIGPSYVSMDMRLGGTGQAGVSLDMMDLDGIYLNWSSATTVSMVRHDRHLGDGNDITLTIPFSGSMRASQCGANAALGNGHAVILRAALPNDVDVAQRCNFVGVKLAEALLEERDTRLLRRLRAQAGPGLLATESPAFKLLRSYIFGLRTIPDGLSTSEAHLASRQVIELFELCLAYPLAGRLPAAVRLDYDSIRKAVRALMERHYQDATITEVDVAGWIGIEPSVIETSFAETNSSFDVELLKIRLGHIGRSLRDPASRQRRIGEVALEHGVDDSRALMLAFERFFGTDPETYRRTRMG